MANEMVLASGVNVDELYRIGKMLALSGYFDAKGNNDMAIAQICTKVLAGAEMGYGPFASVQGIHIIQGRPSIAANLMAAAVKAHPMYDYRVRTMTDKECSIEFFQRMGDKWESLGVSTFTADDARKAQTKNMDKYARNMLFARAMSNGVKWYTPDCFNGNAVYVPEELGAEVDGDGNVIDVDYRSVDKATGEVLSTTPPAPEPKANGKSNGNGKPAQAPQPEPNLDLPPIVAQWTKPDDAYIWAVGAGAASGGVAHAKNVFSKIVTEQFDGKFRQSNAAEVYTAFYHECLKRAKDAEDAEQAAHDDEVGDNPFEEVAEMAA